MTARRATTGRLGRDVTARPGRAMTALRAMTRGIADRRACRPTAGHPSVGPANRTGVRITVAIDRRTTAVTARPTTGRSVPTTGRSARATSPDHPTAIAPTTAGVRRTAAVRPPTTGPADPDDPHRGVGNARPPYPGRGPGPRPDRPFQPAPALPPPDLLGPDEELIAGRRPVEEAFAAGRDGPSPARRAAATTGARAPRPPRDEPAHPDRRGRGRLADRDRRLRRPPGRRRSWSSRAGAPRIDDILARAVERGEPPFVLVLDSLEDPQNVGTLLRSAEAAGVHGVLFPTHRQAPLTPVRGQGLGGGDRAPAAVPGRRPAGGLADLHVRGLRVAGAEADAPLTVRQTDLRGPLALVVGSEGQGLGPAVRRRCDLFMRIPMRGAIGSLNAAVAGSILLFEALAQRDPDGRSTPPAPFDAPRAPEPDELATTDAGPADEAIAAESADATPDVPSSTDTEKAPKPSKAAKGARTPKPAKAKPAKAAKAARAAKPVEVATAASESKPAKTPKTPKPSKAAKLAEPAQLAEPTEEAKPAKAAKPARAVSAAKSSKSAKLVTATTPTATTAESAKSAKPAKSAEPGRPVDQAVATTPPMAAKRSKAPAPGTRAPAAKAATASDDDLLPGEPAARATAPATSRTRKPRTPRA